MNRLVHCLTCCTLAVLSAPVAYTQAAPAPLTEEEVLASSLRHFPAILQGMAGQQAAAGKVLEAQGAFDLVFSADGFSRLDGFYDGSAVKGQIAQPLRPLGAEIYTGYKLSDGTFPIYEDINYTNTDGALQVGALFSLLRDRSIDQRRFAQLDAQLGAVGADLDLLLTKVGVQQRALLAYWRWVAIGRQVEVYEDLLRIALERQVNLEEQVESGARAEIFLTENMQNITRRQSLVTSARRDLKFAANSLSLFYRDEEGALQVPDSGRLPAGELQDQFENLDILAEVAAADAVVKRPEIALLRNAVKREQNRIELSENDLQARLDFDVGVLVPFGDVAEGGVSRDTTNTVVGFQFSVPFQRRAVKGRLEQSRANMNAIRQEQRLIEDRIQLEVRNILLELNVVRDLLEFATQEVSLAEAMRAAEIQRFESGASDFFLVNLREVAAANAQIKLLEAELDTRLARANFDAATVNLERLGIVGDDF